jgi:hypothetical protein
MRRILAITGLVVSIMYVGYMTAWGSSAGISGHTNGCGGDECHSHGGPKPTLIIDGPDILTAGESGTYTVSIIHELPFAGGGLNFSVSAGELGAGDNTRLENGEITHSTNAATRFSFTITAPQDGTSEIALSGVALAADLDGTAAGDTFTIDSKTIMVIGDTTTSSPPTTITTQTPTTTTEPPTTTTTINIEPPTTLIGDPPITSPPTTIPPRVGFSDVPRDLWFYPYVIELVSEGVIDGYPDGTFKPNSSITRAEFAKVTCLAMGWMLESPAKPSFKDVDKGNWAYRFIETVRVHGAISGYPDGTFKPGTDISRAEIVTILAKTLHLPAGASRLTDIGSCWAKDYVNACAEMGIINGYGDSTFRPNNTATRAESAKMVAEIAFTFEIVSAQVQDDRVRIELLVNGEPHIFSLFLHNADGTTRTTPELIERFKSFSVERLRAWGIKPNATIDDIKFVGIDKLERLKLEG